MKYLILVTIILFSSSLVFSQKVSDDFTGKWKAPKGAIIIVSKTTAGFVGRTEKESALVLKDVKFSSGKWTAIVLNPKENKIAYCELILEQSKLKIIIRKGILFKTIIWVKQ